MSTSATAPAAAGAGDSLSTSSRGLRSFIRLVSMLRPFRMHVLATALIAIAVTASRLLIPRYTGLVIDAIDAGDYEAVNGYIVRMVLAGVVMAVLNSTRRLIAGTISLGLEKLLRERIFAHLSHQSHSFFDTRQTGQLLSRATIDVTQVRFFLGYGLTYFFMHLTMLIAVPVVCFMISPTLALVAVTMMPLIFYISLRYSRRAHPILKEVQQRSADVTTATEENIVGARVVRAFGQEQAQIDQFAGLTQKVVDKQRENIRLGARYQPLYTLITGIVTSVIVLLSGVLIDSGDLTLGQFFAFYGYLLLLVGPVRIIGSLLGRAQRATASSERIWELLDTDESLPVAERPALLPDAPSSMVEFDGVTFSYGAGKAVLHDVSFSVPAGSTVALLGPTGSGKTTLAGLVPRFRDVDEGRVLIDGIDVRDLDLAALRSSVGVVDQEPFLFSDTVAANLRFGAPRATDDEVWAALAAAQVDGVVRRLPDGLDTVIGERGITLSGGQRQRLAIARALLVNPRILILDDATASVDSRVEARITQALGDATTGRTTFLIAHRPSTIALADVIVVLNEGTVADVGTHDELMLRNAMYRQVQEQRAARREFLVDPAAEAEGADAAPEEDDA